MIGSKTDAGLLDPQRATWALVAVVGCALFVLSMPPVPDHAYQFYLASQVLSGARLYVDVAAADMHPPLFTWMAAAIQWFADTIGVSGLSLYHVVVIGLTAASIAMIGRIGPTSGMLLVVIVAALFPVAGPYFGQGEHLALVLSLPYLFSAAQQARAGHTTGSFLQRALVAIAAAFGLAMKPYFALVWVGTELYLARQLGWRSLWRLESVTIGCLFVLYVAATLAVTPEFFGLLPWIMQLYPRYVPIPFIEMVFDWRFLVLMAGLIAGWSARRDHEVRALADLLTIAVIAMFATLLLQTKGWGYHWYPVCALALIIIALRVRNVGASLPVIVPALAFAAIAAMTLQVNRTTRLLASPPTSLPGLYRIVDRYPAGSAVLALTQYLHAGFPLTNFTGMQWVLPYGHLWMVPAIHSLPLRQASGTVDERAEQWRDLERQIYDRVWEAMNEHPPALFILERPEFGGIDMRRYFERDRRFREYFRRLEPIDTVGLYVVYDTAGQHE